MNGAVDNATGTSGLLAIAKAFVKARKSPDRSILFLAVTLEESGLLGSAYYVDNPLYPLAQTVAAFNMDAMHFGGPTRDVLVVTLFGDDGHVIDSIRAGATGYLLKDALPKDITASILQVHGGGSPISPAIARRVLTSFGEHQNSGPAEKLPPAERTARPSVLTERETEILRLVAKGLNFKEVAGILAISPNTVITHVKRIYQKLAVHSRGEAVYEANQMGWL